MRRSVAVTGGDARRGAVACTGIYVEGRLHVLRQVVGLFGRDRDTSALLLYGYLGTFVYRTTNSVGRLDLLALVLVQTENYFDLKVYFLGALSPVNPGVPRRNDALVNISDYFGDRFRELG